MFTPADMPMFERLHAIADRVQWMMHDRAITAYCRAFGAERQRDSRLDMCVIHNSLVSRDSGRPWPEVNYDYMRKAAWLAEKSLEPSRIVNSWYRRKCLQDKQSEMAL